MLCETPGGLLAPYRVTLHGILWKLPVAIVVAWSRCVTDLVAGSQGWRRNPKQATRWTPQRTWTPFLLRGDARKGNTVRYSVQCTRPALTPTPVKNGREQEQTDTPDDDAANRRPFQPSGRSGRRLGRSGRGDNRWMPRDRCRPLFGSIFWINLPASFAWYFAGLARSACNQSVQTP